MKKLLPLTLLSVSLTLFQSCKTDDIDAAPDKIVTTPAGINLESLVKSSNFFLGDAKAILVKPVDNDPATHLTTLFQIDATNKVVPLVENFEIKDVRVTTHGIYVVTNYLEGSSPIAFFVKPNREFVQLKDIGLEPRDIGLESKSTKAFLGENDNGDIVFSNGVILNTKTLATDRTHTLTAPEYISMISGNYSLVNRGSSSYRIVNQYTKVSYDLQDGNTSDILSFKNTDWVMINESNPFGFPIIDMKTGIEQYYELSQFGNQNIRFEDGSVSSLYHHFGDFEDVISTLQLEANPKAVVVPKSVKTFPIGSDIHVQTYYNLSHPANVFFKSANWFVVRAAYLSDRSGVVRLIHESGNGHLDILKGVTINTMSVEGSTLFYSGTKDGQPVTGIFDLTAQTNKMLDNNLYQIVQPL